MQCDGIVALRANKTTGKVCEVKGQLDFLGATIGYLDLRGIKIERSQSKGGPITDEHSLLRLELARVKRDLRLDKRSGGIKTVVNGHIDAFNLRVGGDLIFDDLTISIDLTSSHVERNLILRRQL